MEQMLTLKLKDLDEIVHAFSAATYSAGSSSVGRSGKEALTINVRSSYFDSGYTHPPIVNDLGIVFCRAQMSSSLSVGLIALEIDLDVIESATVVEHERDQIPPISDELLHQLVALPEAGVPPAVTETDVNVGVDIQPFHSYAGAPVDAVSRRIDRLDVTEILGDLIVGRAHGLGLIGVNRSSFIWREL